MSDRRERKMMSRRIKYAMAHLSRKQHISLLARPNWRRTQKLNMNVVADPNYVPRAALKCRPSKRIKIMAQPKYVTKKYDPARAPQPYQRIHPRTLSAKSSRRILDLALPKKTVLMSTMRFATNNKTMAVTVSDLLRRLGKSRYQRYRILCNAVQRRAAAREEKLMAQLRKSLSTAQDWQRHLQILEKLAAPKVVPRPKLSERRKKWRPIDPRRIDMLAQPTSKELPDVRDPFTVPPAALTYKISSRMEEIAFRKNPPQIIPPRIPGAVSPAALKAIATPRTIILAKPVERPAGMETDLREDAFTVSPAALKAKYRGRPKAYK